MGIKQSIASTLQLFAVLLFLALGTLLLLLPSFADSKIFLADLVLTREDLFYESGLAFLVIGLFFFFGFFGLNRGYYFVLKMGKNTFSIDEKILWKTIEPELKKEFPQKIALQKIEIGRSKLYFTVEMAPLNEEEREETLLQAEKHLETLLRERFGYRKPFLVQVFRSTADSST